MMSWLVMIGLLAWLIGYAVIAERRDRYAQTLRYIHIYQGKFGPFRNNPPKGFSRLQQQKLIHAAARARSAAAVIPLAGSSQNPSLK